MSRRTLPWFDSLTDSVYALGEAAREYQHAHRQALLMREGVDFHRRQTHNGEIDIVKRAPIANAGERDLHYVCRAPHEHALSKLGDLHSQRELELHGLYTEAALLYASGAVWAARHVQASEQPARVPFRRTEEGELVWKRGLEIDGLDRYSEATQLEAACNALLDRLHADEYAEHLAGRDHIADHEAGWMFDAREVAKGIGDAAYAYGVLAERAVHFVLIGPKRDHARQLVAARAAAESAQAGIEQ